MASPTLIQLIGATLFAVAVLHTFCTGFFERLARAQPRHAGIWHLLGEVEVVFGFWALILTLYMFVHLGRDETIAYIEARNFTEPMFVFAIMVVAGTRPVLRFIGALVKLLAAALPIATPVANYVVILTMVPLLGSFITEPAAMTLAALMLRDGLFTPTTSTRLKYATLGVLFVNISIGGTLTTFAAPPVLMVASTWGWDMAYMLTNFGWKAVVAIVTNAAIAALLFKKELANSDTDAASGKDPVPFGIVAAHLMFLGLIVLFAHHPAVFMAVFLFFLGFSTAYERHQDPLILKEALLVAFFLAGLVVLGGQQAWWLEPVLVSLSPDQVFYGAAALTAITDNAALTYLASLVPGLSTEFKLSVVAGAVSGGGLTLIANAPNPAGAAILRGEFEDGTIHPMYLLLGAAIPTGIAMMAFRLP